MLLLLVKNAAKSPEEKWSRGHYTAAASKYAGVSLCDRYHICFFEINAGNVINIFYINDVLLLMRMIIVMDWNLLFNTQQHAAASSSSVNDQHFYSYSVKWVRWWDRRFGRQRSRRSTSQRPHICPSTGWVFKKQCDLSRCTWLLKGRKANLISFIYVERKIHLRIVKWEGHALNALVPYTSDHAL